MAGETRGRLVLSIDLELVTRAGSLEYQRQLDAVASQLTEALAQHHLPATIAVADPLHSAATEQIAASPLGHEIAILGDASWVGRGAGRERFGRELDRRIHKARKAGLHVTSLALRNVDLTENYDLLTKHALTAIRLGHATAPAQAPLLRFGMWQMPVSLALPHTPRWFQSTVRLAKKTLRNAVQSGGIAHLAIDAGRLAEGEAVRLVEVLRVLALAGEWQQAGRLEVLTLQQLVSNLDRPEAAAPQRSILRAA